MYEKEEIRPMVTEVHTDNKLSLCLIEIMGFLKKYYLE